MTGVLLVDDQPIVRAGLRMLCQSAADLEVVGEAGNGEVALRAVCADAPEVVVMDLRMPVMDGVRATELIARDHPGSRVLVLTTFDEDEHLYAALRAGAAGFLAKHAEPERVLAAIRAVAAGETVFSPEVLARIVSRAMGTGTRAELPALTEREREVLALLATGASNAEIGERLFLAVTTVKTHVSALAAKTGCANRVQLAVLAVRAGLDL
ncbi:response regulator transcription factor [Kutzneria albida]|uniref:LuxR family two component transcription regulator n=1 Tax=Kutzneria albida DSM 43870 TaxID=1449976 RepID=W5WCH4_9PSEU|nr:response regulator transcription factor [Kutzneria albida]AHH95914.1 LuxR family two component transcription regulator [Kutzneria albida DSM 43870]